jgi:hypothetical protein
MAFEDIELPPITLTPEENDRATRYIELMEEIRGRLDAVERARQKPLLQAVFGAEYLSAEFAMLQLRMVCELIALGCVIAHGDLPIARTPKFNRDIKADMIFRKMRDYHTDFFPRAISRVMLPNGIPSIVYRTDAMTQDELVSLYRYCHDRLHRGRAEDILAQSPRVYDYAYLDQSITKLIALLSEHTLTLSREDDRGMAVCMNWGGQVAYWWTQPLADPPEGLDISPQA